MRRSIDFCWDLWAAWGFFAGDSGEFVVVDAVSVKFVWVALVALVWLRVIWVGIIWVASDSVAGDAVALVLLVWFLKSLFWEILLRKAYTFVTALFNFMLPRFVCLYLF